MIRYNKLSSISYLSYSDVSLTRFVPNKVVNPFKVSHRLHLLRLLELLE